jgi:flagellar secretion chaperone FliS
MNATRAYARTASETASRERLMLQLFETALRHMRHAASLIDEGKAPEALPLLTKASKIVAELAATLDAAQAPELAQTLGDLYAYVTERLAYAAWTRSATAAREAERAFSPVVEGFQQAVTMLQSRP